MSENGTTDDVVPLLRDGEWWQSVVRGQNPTSFTQDMTHVAQQAADEIERLRAALQAIHESHIPDQPASVGMSREDWAYSHVGRLRGIAGRALNPDGMKATVR